MSLTRFQSRALDGQGAPQGAPRVHVVTFGCQMNKYDSLLAEGRFRRRGYVTTESADDADVILFNTCSVRDHAEERAYSWLGEIQRAKAARPELVIGVMGCMAERVEGELFRRAKHVDIVCGTRQFQHLPELVDEIRARRAEQGGRARVVATGDGHVSVEREGEPYTGGRTGFLAVMRGCDLNCTFCIVPSVRGRVQSRPIEDLVREARWMVEHGAQVITLLGQTVNSYGEDLPAPQGDEPVHRGRQGRASLADLLYRLQEIEGLARIRMITAHAAYATRALALAIRDCDKVERFLPLPAQHGSDRILKAMKRGYTVDLYRRRAAMLREIVPDLELGSDWIVGFPGETEEDYAQCESVLAEQEFSVNYVFKYDPRPSTRAADELRDDVPAEVKQERNQRLLCASESVQAARLRREIGREHRVFVEELSVKRPGTVRGRTRTGVPVSLKAEASSLGTELRVKIEEASAYGLGGSLVNQAAAAE
ncbi:MAG: tRNA (N6-isopentenyl adenosine(37)-C2)-methylthiotransferase MiaB [Planctomycetes bacterium]|nr:tRNA (N6-isopentenyl adenosine(37)-C2)-methylthiotransferase MiaB [Planctomycetota bacterium]